MTATLTVTAKGQVTLRKEVLEHLGVRPGDKVEVELLAAGRVEVRARPRLPISQVFGILKDPAKPRLTLAEIDAAIAKGWAGER